MPGVNHLGNASSLAINKLQDKPIIEILGIVICGLGLLLLIIYLAIPVKQNCVFTDYTDCQNSDETTVPRTCADTLRYIKPGSKCYCYLPINITEDMQGSVTLYYELESYDEIIKSSASRDDNQLRGDLSLTPSPSCGEYTYVNTTEGRKPIAPCGELADRMFSDKFSLHTGNEVLPRLYTGLLRESDKSDYHNPPGNLQQAFKNFAKPKSWENDVWALDTTNPDNNGFQNEAFIAWMLTDMKRKPAWRVNHTGVYQSGLPKGIYSLTVVYTYPPERYSGRRVVYLCLPPESRNSTLLGFAITFLIIGLIVAIFRVIKNKIKHDKWTYHAIYN